MIEAPVDAIDSIIARHPDLRRLFDGGWLHLFAIDDAAGCVWRYRGDLEWEVTDAAVARESAAA